MPGFHRSRSDHLQPAESSIDGEVRASSTGETFEPINPTAEAPVGTIAATSAARCRVVWFSDGGRGGSPKTV